MNRYKKVKEMVDMKQLIKKVKECKDFNEFIKKVIRHVYFKLLRAYTLWMDRRIGGKDLSGIIPSTYKELGAYATESTDYRALKKLFKVAFPSDSDFIVDVGCGKGRVISYLLLRGFKGRIVGVDLDENIAGIARERLKNHENVAILTGSILDNMPKEATVFYLFNPFNSTILEQFVQKIEEEIDHDVKLLYAFAVHRNIFKDRPGWENLHSWSIERRYSRAWQNELYICHKK